MWESPLLSVFKILIPKLASTTLSMTCMTCTFFYHVHMPFSISQLVEVDEKSRGKKKPRLVADTSSAFWEEV